MENDYYNRNMTASYKACFWCFVGIVVTIIIYAFAGCKSIKYVPVETVRTEIVHQTDTVHITDSVETTREITLREARPEDSLKIAKLGLKLQENERLLILTQWELQKATSTTYENHNKDSVRVDSIQVPYPVERKLNRWEQFKMDYGAVAFCGTIAGLVFFIYILLRWLRRKYN